MCSIAASRGALAFGAAAFLDRRRGVAAAAPLARGAMAREPAPRVGTEACSAARTQKRTRDSLDGKARAREGSAAGEMSAAVSALGQRRLQERMKAELQAVRDLHRKAVLLCRGGAGRSGAPPAAKGDVRLSADGSRQEAPSEAVAKRRKASPSKPTMEAAQQIKGAKQQQAPVQRAAPLPERKMEKTKELQKRRLMEEIARAREECRQQVLEVEMAALPDENIHPQDWEELGIAEFEYAVTRTRSQARSEDLGMDYGVA